MKKIFKTIWILGGLFYQIHGSEKNKKVVKYTSIKCSNYFFLKKCQYLLLKKLTLFSRYVFFINLLLKKIDIFLNSTNKNKNVKNIKINKV